MGLFTPWTMKSSQVPVEFVIGCLTCPMTTSIYTKEKIVRVTMEFEVPNKYNSRPTVPTDMVQQVVWWERQNMCSCRKRQGAHGREMLLYYIYIYYFILFF